MATLSLRLRNKRAFRTVFIILFLLGPGIRAHSHPPEREEFDLEAVLFDLKGDNRALQMRAAPETVPPGDAPVLDG